MFKIDQEHTTMKNNFNSANTCTPKKLAKQLLVASAKLLNHEQRPALLDIFKTLDEAEDSAQYEHNAEPQYLAPPQHQFDDELNQEYWSGQHYDSDNQEYPKDWLRRTKKRPHRTLSETAY